MSTKYINKQELLVLGDEAIAFGAIDAGVKGVFGYPGTPSTEIFEMAEKLVSEKNDGRVARWAANEKVAYETALGCSYAGCRALVTMKHVGLNVAMDPFVNSALTGVKGGMVVAVADDPGMHSSQNEQDTRYLTDFAHLPVLEPSNVQEAYQFTRTAFDLSEYLSLPVVIRIVTRLAHSRSILQRKKEHPIVNLGLPTHDETFNWVLIPGISREKYKKLRNNLPVLQKAVERYNKLHLGESIGIVVVGMGRAYIDQLYNEVPALKNFTRLDVCAYPLEHSVLEEMLAHCELIYVFEEDYPYVEDQFISMSRHTRVHGRRDRTMPISGELTPILIREVLNINIPETMNKPDISLPLRPPRLCKGCGHIDTFEAIRDAFMRMNRDDYRVFGDIGCYTLGVQKPFESLHSTVCMGASVGMALGAALAGFEPSVAVIGDSTFFHSGIQGLIGVVNSNVNVNIIVMDNHSTAMTGQQPTVLEDRFLSIAAALGLPENSIHEFNPLPKYHESNVERLIDIFSTKKPSFIVFKRECVQAARKRLRQSR